MMTEHKNLCATVEFFKPCSAIPKPTFNLENSLSPPQNHEVFKHNIPTSPSGNRTRLAKYPLADETHFCCSRYLLHLREDLLERLAETERWRPADIRVFEREHETDPYNDYDLYRIGRKRLSDIKNEVERSDTGLRAQLADSAKERNFRIWLAHQLRERRRDRYTVAEEIEIDQQQHPDIRLENSRAGYVPLEIKLASEWSLPVLLERLENQLFGQYLPAHDGRYGFFVLGLVDIAHRWDNPAGGQRLTFNEVVTLLERRAIELSDRHHGMKQGSIVAIDFRSPAKL